MKKTERKSSLNRGMIGIILFVIGVVLAMVLIGFSVYADFESTLFDLTNGVNRSIRSIKCPVFLSSQETGNLSAVIKNPEDRTQELVIQASISNRDLILLQEFQENISIAPYEAKQLKWEVEPPDAAYGHLILAKVIVMDVALNPSHRGSCGIIILKLPDGMKGWELFWIIFVLSGIGILSGIIRWWKYGRPNSNRGLEATRSLFGLGGLAVIGLVSITLSFWELAAGAFYIGLLLMGVLIPHFLIKK